MQSFLQNHKLINQITPKLDTYSTAHYDDLLSIIEEIKKFSPVYFKEANKQLETLVPVGVVH